MIIWLCGVSASGKSTALKNIFEDLGTPYLIRCKSEEHEYNIRCYRKGKILTVGRKIGHVTAGLDGVMFGIEKFKNFLKVEYSNWDHIILDGNKFIDREIMHQYLLDQNFEYKVYYFCPPLEELVKRSKIRNNGNDTRFLKNIKLREKHIEKYENIFQNEKYSKNMSRITNLNMEESNKITEEILCTIKE
tara:strand:+ start:857 stop:1426 length:570 start_codon:yes stop_codon:yes gene_type:complete